MMQSSAAKIIDIADSQVWEKSYPPGRDWAMDLTPAPVFDILDRTVAQYGASAAIDFEGMKLSYNDLGALVAKIACGLQKLGVRKGIKVGLFLPNSHYSIAVYYGILKAGGTVVNYNPLYAERELVSQVEDSETDFLVTPDSEASCTKAIKVLEATRLSKLIVCPMQDGGTMPEGDSFISFEALTANDGAFKPVEIDPMEDIAVLQYTGGTTGTPKGAMLTHANVYANTAQMAHWFGDLVEPGKDVQIGVLPLFHVFAMTVVMNVSVWCGMEIVPVAKFDLKKIIPLLTEKNAAFFPAVPAIFTAITASLPGKIDLSFTKYCLSGGAPLPVEVMKGFAEKTGAMTGEGYGLTETSPVVTCNPPVRDMIRPGSIGLPIPGTIVEIVSMEDGVTILPPGEKGELCVRGPQVMKGYYKKPEETDNVIKNGRLHTGDVAYMDADGYVFIVDRLKDMVLVNGYNVYPRQVEEAFYLHPSVAECIVAGVYDEKRGETVQAWVVPREGCSLTEKELRTFLSTKISPIEMPRKITVREAPLPKTAVGKLSRKMLLEEEGITK